MKKQIVVLFWQELIDFLNLRGEFNRTNIFARRLPFVGGPTKATKVFVTGLTPLCLALWVAG